MVITANTEKGAVARFTLSPGEHHESDSCGTIEVVDITRAGLVWRPRVIEATTGLIRTPKLARGVESVSESTPSTSAIDPAVTTTRVRFFEKDYLDEYTLISDRKLGEVTDINIDGNLAYARDEEGRLVSLSGGTQSPVPDDGRESRQLGAGDDARFEPSGDQRGFGYQPEI